MRRNSSFPFPSRRRRLPATPPLLTASLLLGAALLLSAALPWRGAAEAPLAMPEFKHQQPSAWLNSPPLSRDDLRGQVVLVEIWTSV
jgi:hypothetical protein